MKLALAASCGVLVSIVACAGGHDEISLGTGGSSTTISSGGGGGIGTGAGGQEMCAVHCSSDLHDIVDCNGKVQTRCPAGEGCGKTGCVPACESASNNKSSIGCDFYVLDPDSDVPGSCLAAFVANTWTSAVSLTADRDGERIDLSKSAYLAKGTGLALTYVPLPNGKIPVGEVAIVFLSVTTDGVPCPKEITPALIIDAAVHGTGYGQAIHLTSDAPVVAYDIFPYGGGQAAVTSATLLLPTSAWDTNYVAVDGYSYSSLVGTSPTLDIVAQEDGTKVTMNPSVNIIGGLTVRPAFANSPVTFDLSQGQILQFAQNAELIGSAIESNKPIGVWGGHQCMNIDPTTQYCDAAHQQIPPVKALGNEYVAVRYRNRYDGVEESPPWRFVGAVDGTKLTYEPSRPVGAPTTLASGQPAEFNAAGPFVVKSQDKDHPFYMSGHMTSCGNLDMSEMLTDCRGDPEFVNVLPPDQYLTSYVFFTDPTYPETNLVLVRKKVGKAFADVKLDCAGTLGGWTAADSSGVYEYTRVDLSTGNYQGQNGCDNGRHEITSDAPFALTVWGWGSGATGSGHRGDGVYTQAVSYAYPAGASVQPINTVRVPVTPK